MRIFVHESICGGDVPDAAPSLLREGAAMLASMVEDLAGVPEVGEVVTLLDPRYSGVIETEVPGVRVEIAVGEGARSRFDALARDCTFTLVIAPETNGLLESRTRRVVDAGGRILGCSPDAVALAADKIRLGGHLRQAGVSTPEILPLKLEAPPLPADISVSFPAILRPRLGAGALFTYRVLSANDLERLVVLARADGAPPEMTLSPLVHGVAASASFIVAQAGHTALAPGFQRLSTGERIRYEGGEIPLQPRAARQRARALAARALETVPGLRGFVGVDLILGETPQDDAIIEINPRLTTSYTGLRRYHAPWDIARCWLETRRSAALREAAPLPVDRVLRF